VAFEHKNTSEAKFSRKIITTKALRKHFELNGFDF
jgi:hypothetical protein